MKNIFFVAILTFAVSIVSADPPSTYDLRNVGGNNYVTCNDDKEKCTYIHETKQKDSTIVRTFPEYEGEVERW